MSVTVQEILQELKAFAPVELACSWDNVGLLVDAGRPVSRVLTALDMPLENIVGQIDSLQRQAALRRRGD